VPKGYDAACRLISSSQAHAEVGTDGKSTAYHAYQLPLLSRDALIEQLTHTAMFVTGMHEVSGSIVEFFESPKCAYCSCSELTELPLHSRCCCETYWGSC
jgi:hypothetical protein